MRTGVHQNSIEAYHSSGPLISKRARLVLDWFRANGPATDRGAMEGLGFREPNQVRPRITELIDAKELREVGSVSCPVTGKTVRLVDAGSTQGSLFS